MRITTFRLNRLIATNAARVRKSDVVMMAKELLHLRNDPSEPFNTVPPIEVVDSDGEPERPVMLDDPSEIEIASQIIGAALASGVLGDRDREEVVDEALAYAQVLMEKSGA